jgi:hypothetical protein
MKTRILLLAALATLTSSSAAAAAPAAPPTRPEMRLGVQQQYILTALWEGRLPWAAAKALLVEQDVVAIRLERFRADGTLCRREVEVLDYMLDIASRNIERHLRTPDRQLAPAPASRRAADVASS